MTQDGLDLLRRAARDSGRVQVDLGDGDQIYSGTVAELIADGLLRPLPNAGSDSSRLTYVITDGGREAVRWREE